MLMDLYSNMKTISLFLNKEEYYQLRQLFDELHIRNETDIDEKGEYYRMVIYR